MVSNPATGTHLFCIAMESVFGKAVLMTQQGEGSAPFLFKRPGKISRLLPCSISAHQTKPFVCLAQDCIVERPGNFQMCVKTRGLPSMDTQGKSKPQVVRLAALQR